MKKHNMSAVLVEPRAMVPHVNGEAAQRGEARLALNVREQEQALQVTGMPATAGAITAGERLLLMTDGHRVTAAGLTVKIDGTAVVTLDSPIVGAYRIGSMIVVVGQGGLTYLSLVNGSWRVMNPADAVPALTFAASTATSQATIEAYEFAEPYSQWRAPLTDEDASALSRMLRAAWDALNADAVAEGRHVAPMLVRWAVRLLDDTYLWMSDPVRVGDETLVNADRIDALVDYDSSGFTGTQATVMPLVHYSVAVQVTRDIAAEWLPLVKSIDVLATDEARLLTASRALDYRCITRTSGAREYVLEMGLSRRSATAIARGFNVSPWRLVATAPAAAHLSGSDFAAPMEDLSLSWADCAAVGSLGRLTGAVCATAAGGRLYCCTAAGDVVVTAPGNALVEAHRRRVAGPSPLAMAVVTKPLYSGGFGRYPVYLFTDDGIYAIPQTTMGSLGEARLVDRQVIDGAVSPVEGGGDVWFVSRHGHLCRLRGAQVSVCQCDVHYKALAWCQAHGELWLLPREGCPRVMMASGAMSERSLEVADLYSDPLHALAVTATGTLLDLEQETAAVMPVQWHSHPVGLDALMGLRVGRVLWHLSSSAATLTLRVNGQRGVMAAERDVSVIHVDGAIDQPLATAPILVPARTVTLHLDGTAASGTLLLPVKLYLH